MENKTELKATLQKSYYKKAHVISNESGVWLKSYDTIVCGYSADTHDFVKLWNGYSLTTMKHINDFRMLNNDLPINKKTWDSIPCENGNVDRYKVEFSNGFVNWKSSTTFDNYYDTCDFGEKVAENNNYRFSYCVIEC